MAHYHGGFADLGGSGTLRITLSHALGLKSMDSNGFSDPYVKLSLGKHHVKSKTIKKTLNPRCTKAGCARNPWLAVRRRHVAPSCDGQLSERAHALLSSILLEAWTRLAPLQVGRDLQLARHAA
jgi:hypothetical protein